MIETVKRWKMNCMGFLNFWLYDEQEFPFSDGKLLLRGSNGSGKSITTQSFIPFILDGNRSPERLDPFGSRDRKMDYYMLESRGEDVSTGYLYLEFKLDGQELYRTVGIGLRAQKGKTMSFWGFCLKDGRRIGYDLLLYKEVGNIRIPLTKTDLKKEFDPDCFVESGKAYMEMVNRYLFGFQRLEQYDQFIRLQIQVRAPKLSKEFNPTKVYQILNNSLQTLSNDDLRAMVDAMENLDEIQNRLESYRDGLKDAAAIKREYDRYNQFMLGQKAIRYDKIRRQVKNHFKNLDQREREVSDITADLTTQEQLYQTAVVTQECLETEQVSLGDTDLQNAIARLDQLKTELRDLETDQKAEEEALEKCREQSNTAYQNQKKVQEELEMQEVELASLQRDLTEYQEDFMWERHGTYLTDVIKARNPSLLREFEDAAEYVRSAIKSAQKSLEGQRQAQDQYSLEEEKWQREAVKRDQAGEEVKQARTVEDQERDNLIEAFYQAASQNRELQLESDVLKQLTNLITNYRGMQEDKEMTGLLSRLEKQYRNQLEQGKLTADQQYKDQDVLYRQAAADLAELKQYQELPPTRSEKQQAARTALKAAGVPFKSFYETVDFAKGLTGSERAILEAQLWEMGILDALVIPEASREQAKVLLGDYHEKYVLPEADGSVEKLFGRLILEPVDEGFRQVAGQMLNHLADEENASVLLAADGRFRHGLIAGHSLGEAQALYIGSETRKENHRRQIIRQEQIAAQLKEILREKKNQIQHWADRLTTLSREWQQMPMSDDLLQAIQLSLECTVKLNKHQEILQQYEAEKNQAHERLMKANQEVLNTCQGLPYQRTLKAYREADQAAAGYLAGMNRVRQVLAQWQHLKDMDVMTRDRIEQLEEQVDECHGRLQRICLSRQKKSVDLEIQEQFVNSPENLERKERLTQIQEQLKELKQEIPILFGTIERLKERKHNVETEIVRLKEEQQVNIETENTARICYEEEKGLGFVSLPEGAEDSILKAAIQCLREGDRLRDADEMYTILSRSYAQHSNNLTAYQPMFEECFERTHGYLRARFCIRFTWDGQKFSLYEFIDYIKSLISDTELLILDEDRKLFEDILADTLVQKLNNRIIESRRWIKDMSALMQEMDTSMGLKFSLNWKSRAKDDNEELETDELEKLFSRDRNLLTESDKERVSRHFRMKIQNVKRVLEENQELVNYADLVRDALDYRKWFEFKMSFTKPGKDKKELTNSVFNQFSGGEKAMAMYVPLFAAVSAHYQMAEPGSPYIIALDEAFAGVDEKNINEMFDLVEKLKFGYIMNSQALWGCYESVKALSICQLEADSGQNMVFVIPHLWNGRERVLNLEGGY